jgi:hypothetical protein
VFVLAEVVVEEEALDSDQAVELDPLAQVRSVVPVHRADRQVCGTPPAGRTAHPLSIQPVMPVVHSGRRLTGSDTDIRLFDGGTDGIAQTTGDNRLFAAAGLFFP